MTTLLISQLTPLLNLLFLPLQATTPITIISIATAPASTLGYKKELVNAAKLYTDDQKYSGISGNFNFKLIIFYNIYNRADVSPNAYLKALPLILMGLALNHYYNGRLAILMFNKAYQQLHGFFKGPRSERQTLSKQNKISLTEIMSKNIGKLTNNYLQILVNKLFQL